MEGALEKFNLSCLFCNIKFKVKNRYVKRLWRFLTSEESVLKFHNRSIVEKDFLVAIFQKPDCLNTDLFPWDVRVFGKEIQNVLKLNENNYRLECCVHSKSFKHTVLYKKVPVSKTLEGDTIKKFPCSAISSDELNEYKAAFLSHISRVTNKDGKTQGNSRDPMTEFPRNNDSLEHSADDVAMTSNDDMWQDYYMSDNAEESTPNNDYSQEHNDDVVVVSSVDMWQEYMSDNAEESSPNNDRVEYMSDDNDNGISERKNIQRREAQDFTDSVVCDISHDALSKLIYTIRGFFKKTRVQVSFRRLTPSQLTFLTTVAEKPHLLVTAEGLPKRLREAGSDVLALLKLNRQAYKWECVAVQNNVVYKKVPIPGRKIADASKSAIVPENIIFDAKITKLPMSGDCVTFDPQMIMDPWFEYEAPIFSALLKEVNDDRKVLSFLARLNNFLNSNDREIKIRTKSYPLTELIFKISARVPYLDTDIFSAACRSVGVAILKLLLEKSVEYKVACLVKGPPMFETITFKKMCSSQARKLINKKIPCSAISSDELNEYKAAFLSHISRVTNKDGKTQGNSCDPMTEFPRNNDNLEHSADDVAMTSNDDMWQDYYMSDNAEESTPNNDYSQEHNDDVVVVSSDDMWQEYMSDNAEESSPNNNDRVEYMSDDNDNDIAISERKNIQRREAQDFTDSVVCDISHDALSKLIYTIRGFFKKTKLEVNFRGLTPSQLTFLTTVAEKPHLLVTAEGLPKRLREAGSDVLALLKLNRQAYKWECVSVENNVFYKKVPIPGRKVANASKSAIVPENTVFDAKITKLPMSGDCVTLDPQMIMDRWFESEWPIFSALLKEVDDDRKVLSCLARLKNFLNSNDREITIRTKSYSLIELIFKISARVPYLDTDIFSAACRSVGVAILKLLLEKSVEYKVACLVKGPPMFETITFKKESSGQARKLIKEKQKAKQAKKAQLKKDKRKDVDKKFAHASDYKERLVVALNTPFATPLTQRMMTKMGWTGGALGKNGGGIATPLMPNLDQIKHAGLGYGKSKKGKEVEEPPPKDQQYHMMMRLLDMLYPFLDDDTENTTCVDVADLGCEDFPKCAANVLSFVNRRQVMYNISLEQEGIFEDVLNLMINDHEDLVLRHSVEADTRINIFKVSLSKYKEEMRSQSNLNKETEMMKPKEYYKALFKSLEAPINYYAQVTNGNDEINNNDFLESIAERNYEELFASPKELLKPYERIAIENPLENNARSWYVDERNWNDQSPLNSQSVERLARDILKCRQKLTDNALDDKNRVLGLIPAEEPEVMTVNVAQFIQKSLLNELDKLPHKAQMKLKCFGIRNNMLIYQALDALSYDWLVDIVKHINVKIFDFSVEENSCRGLLVASNYAIESDEELLERIQEFNDSIDVSAWSVLNKFQVGNQTSYEVVLDRISLLQIFKQNCSLNLGIDQAEFVFVGTL